MGFLAGNDFVPNLPGLHIKQEGLPYLHRKYVSILPKLDGYLSKAGKINMVRFQKYLSSLVEFDIQEFQEHYVSMAFIAQKRNEKRARKQQQEDKETGKETDAGNGELEPFTDFMGMDPDFVMSPTHEDRPDDINEQLSSLGLSQIPADLLEDQEDSDDTFLGIKAMNDRCLVPMEINEEALTDVNFSVDLKKYKRRYYENKFKPKESLALPFLQAVGYEYMRGLQWVLFYYYRGVPSWSWFYPYHYAPFVSDLSEVDRMSIEFALSNPCEPFQQLMSVLPSLSKAIVPVSFQHLMEDNNSPIIDFYPSTFETDLNGKTHEWEAVVLLPFIDMYRLRGAMQNLYQKLTEEETNRNKLGRVFSYSYCKFPDQKHIPPPFPFLSEIYPSFSQEKELPSDPFPFEIASLPFGLLPGVNLSDYIPAYPTFNFVPHEPKKVARPAYFNNVIVEKQRIQLNILEPEESLDLESLANTIVGKECLVNWPFLVRAFVDAVSDGKYVYERDVESREGLRVIEMDDRERDKWEKNVINIDQNFGTKKGINLGKASCMVHANVLVGKRVQFCKKKEDKPIRVEPEWDSNSSLYLLQTVIMPDKITTFDPSPSLSEMTLSSIFFKGRECFIMRKDLYGSPAIVEKVDEMARTIQLKMYNINNESYSRDMHAINEQYMKSLPKFSRYLPGYIIASKANIDKIVFSRITSGLFVYSGEKRKKSNLPKLMISLNVKNSKKNLCVPEYAIREDRGWLFNPYMIDVLREYKRRFPEVFMVLEENPTCDDYYSQDMFDSEEMDTRLCELKEWLCSLPCYEKPLLTCGSEKLPAECIDIVQAVTSGNKLDIATKLKSHRKVVKCKPKELFCPMSELGEFVPDKQVEYYILDRVISISAEVPFGYVGTIIGYSPLPSQELLCEVLFDLEFPCAVSIRGSAKRAYVLKSSLLIDLTHGALERQRQDQQQEGVFGCDESMDFDTTPVVDDKSKKPKDQNLPDSVPTQPAVLPTVPFISHLHKRAGRGTRAFGNRCSYDDVDPYSISPGKQDYMDQIELESNEFSMEAYAELDSTASGRNINIYPSTADNPIVGDLSWLEDSHVGHVEGEPPRDFRKSKQGQFRDTPHYFPRNPMFMHPDMMIDPRFNNFRMPPLLPGCSPPNIFPPLIGSGAYPIPNPRLPPLAYPRPPHFPPQRHLLPPTGFHSLPQNQPLMPDVKNAMNHHPLPPNAAHYLPQNSFPPGFSGGIQTPQMPHQSSPHAANSTGSFMSQYISPNIRIPPNAKSYRDILEPYCTSLGLGFPNYQHQPNTLSDKGGFVGVVKINVDGTLLSFVGVPANTTDEAYESAACKALYEFQSGPLFERGLKSPSPPTLQPHPIFSQTLSAIPSIGLIPATVMKSRAQLKVKNKIIEKNSGQTLLTAQQATLFASKPDSENGREEKA